MNKNDILVIPDCHATPELGNERADYISRLLQDRQPEYVVFLGDVGDFASLRSADKGSKTFEGKRYYKDCNSTIEFFDRALAGFDGHRTIVLGNHEYRVNRLIENNPELEGILDTEKDCLLDDFFHTIKQFKEIADVRGILFSHHFPSGVLGRPISGPNAASRIINENKRSSISGHSHLLSVADGADGVGKRILSIVAGCYVHPKFVGDWNRDTVKLWWNGVVYLRNVEKGYPSSYQLITQKELARVYGKRK